MTWDMAIILVMVLVLVALFAVQTMRKNKYNASLNELRKDLKAGDKVMTDAGLVGVVVDMFEEEEYRYVVLESGRGEHLGYFTVPANAIYYVYGKDTTKTTTKISTTDKKDKKQDK